MIKKILGEKTVSLIGNLIDDFTEEVKHIVKNNLLEYQVEEYNRNIATKTILHRATPKLLSEFYQPLFIREDNYYWQSDNKKIPTDSIDILFNEDLKKQYITIKGSAGSGKSTLIKYLFINAIDKNFKIPIKIELRYLNDYDNDLTHYMKEKIFKFNNIASSDKIVERLMVSGDFIFFLDGYDEINSLRRKRVSKEIDDFVKKYNKNFYIITTRPYTEIELLPLFHNYTICELGNNEINQFIKKQLPPSEKEITNKMIRMLQQQSNHSYRSFLSNPLLLSMFILTFQSYASVPPKISIFYSQVFDTLFSTHDSMSKLAFEREKQSGLNKEQFIEILKLFSFISYFEEKFMFSDIYLNDKLSDIKERRKIPFDNEKLLSDLQIAICIMNKEGTDYVFPHRSMQEYFAALFVSNLEEKNKKKIYNRISSSLLKNNKRSDALSRENFYLLLTELDYKSTVKYILLPLLYNIKEELKIIDLPNSDYSILLELMGYIYVNYISFHLAFRDIDLISNRLGSIYRERSDLHSVFTYGSFNKVKIDKRDKNIVQAILPFMEKLKTEIPQIIIRFENIVKFEEEVDERIISLLD